MANGTAGGGPRNVAAALKAAGVDASRGGDITILPPEHLTVVMDESHPLYDERVTWPLSEERIADFAERGVLQCVLCRRNGTHPDGRPVLEVVDGRRRVLHAIELNKRRPDMPIRVKVEVLRGLQPHELTLTAIAMNSGREDETIRSRALKAKKALALGASERDVQRALNVAPNTMTNILNYLGLAPEVRAAVDAGEVPLGSINLISTAAYERQPELLAQIKTAHATKNHEVAAVVAQVNRGEPVTKNDAGTRKRCWGRREMTQFRALLGEEYSGQDVEVLSAFLDFLLDGETGGLKGKAAMAVKNFQKARRSKKSKGED